jgi:Meckel syndrome type 1 protein
MEMQDYMKDLFQWQKDIKKKDKSIQKHGTARSSVDSTVGASEGIKVSSHPAPRGRAANQAISAAPEILQAPSIVPSMHKATISKSQHLISQQSKKNKNLLQADGEIASTAASHTYAAYKKWDKFDVDSALKSEESGSDNEPEVRKTLGAASLVPASNSSPAPTHSQPMNKIPPASSLYPRDTLPASELQERSTSRSATPPTTSASAGAASSSSSAPQASYEHDMPPIRSQEPQTAEAWRARGNDLFKVLSVDRKISSRCSRLMESSLHL